MSMKSNFSRGSIIFVLYAAIGMVGIIGAASMNIIKGPVKAMSEVTKRTIAENHMIASGRLALIVSAKETGDCDGDGMVEPMEWVDAGANPAPLNGGLLPSTIGAALQDPWGNSYGYCAWDHGAKIKDAGCGASPKRLEGYNDMSNIVIAIISSGPDKVFQTGCQPQGTGSYLLRLPGNDDVVLAYSFAEAMALSGGLWTLKDVDTATINKNLSVTDAGGNEQLTFDAQTRDFSLGSGGTGNLPNIRTDYIQSLTSNAPVEFLANIKTGTAWISGDGTNKGMKISTNGNVDLSGDVAAVGKVKAAAADIIAVDANAVAAIVTASGASSIGLKAKGSSKAIEADGLLDMMSHNIINVAPPVNATDGATKKYVDDKFGSVSSVQTMKCESFVFTSCTGSANHTNLAKANLGACKKACEAAGVQCCEAEFSSLPGNPNAQLATCRGYDAPSQTSGGLRNFLTILLGGGKFVASLCYLE